MDMSTDQEKVFEANVTIPQGVTGRLLGSTLTFEAKLGRISKDFAKIPVNLEMKDSAIRIVSTGKKKTDLSVTHTARSIIRNMIQGVTSGYTYRLKIVYAHFPITVNVKGRQVYIENFYGERLARVAKIVGDCKVTAEKDDLIVTGTSLEDAGQTAANIEQATKIRRRDQRVFLDGVYLYDKQIGIDSAKRSKG